MNGIIIGIIVMSAILYLIFAIYYDRRIYKYIWKPGTMILIILLTIIESGLSTNFSNWVLFALLFSLLGDIFLMLREKWFIHGLVSFFIAHVLYIIGLLLMFRFTFTLTNIVLILFLVLISVTFYFFLFQHVRKVGGIILLVAVAFYIAIITIMVGLASMTGIAILIVASLLFFISDAVLAINKFRVTFRLADYIVMSTYFTAQLLFAISTGGL
ncbi:lysoplasmalogenase [Paucisalibacillus globulus]|uniref:lysoplasmalogenase n=1 Tax=Paucisalibacillus globulus TaxID=351095 RepID=UPI0003FF0226|nr:lysoplasmalogenase [Paucisalibacillus globulus]